MDGLTYIRRKAGCHMRPRSSNLLKSILLGLKSPQLEASTGPNCLQLTQWGFGFTQLLEEAAFPPKGL